MGNSLCSLNLNKIRLLMDQPMYVVHGSKFLSNSLILANNYENGVARL